MRFLVDLYRVIVLAMVAVCLIGGFYLISLLMMGGAPVELNAAAIMAMLAGGVCFILFFGLTATFISIHDRIAEISHQSARLADALERIADSPSSR